MGRLHGRHDRPGEGQARYRSLDGRLGRRRGDPSDVEPRRRIDAALEPGRPLPVLPGFPRHRRGEEARGPGLAARPARRRGLAADRGHGRGRRLRLVPGRPAPRPRRERKGPRRRARKNGGLEAEDDAARRHRPLSFQAGPRGLPQAVLDTPLALRRGRAQGRSPDFGPGPRRFPRLVAGRDADRLLQRSRPGSRPQPRQQRLRRRGQAGRRGPAADHLGHPRRHATRPGAPTVGRSLSSSATNRAFRPTARASWPSFPPRGERPGS